MSHPAKIAVLLATILPILAIHVLALLIIFGDAGSWFGGYFGYLVALVIASQLAVVSFYIWHLKRRSFIPKDQQGGWVAKFIFIRSPFALVDYWYKHIWRSSHGAP